jgi:hypothetical protein
MKLRKQAARARVRQTRKCWPLKYQGYLEVTGSTGHYETPAGSWRFEKWQALADAKVAERLFNEINQEQLPTIKNAA